MKQAIRIEQQNSRRRGAAARRIVVAVLALLVIQQVGLPRAASVIEAQPALAAEPGPGTSTRTAQAAVLPLEVGGTPLTPVLANASAQASASVPPSFQPAPAGPATQTSGGPVWRGTAGQAAYVRAAPNRAAPKIGELQPGEAVRVARWVSGEEVETENTTWADLGDGRYVYSALLRSLPIAGSPPKPAGAPTSGRWIDVNLTLQIATAYEGSNPVKSVLVSTGRPGWETPSGTFAINWRVPKTTMDGSTLKGQGPDGKGATYKVENVRWTQYFTNDGSAIHENYWRNPAIFGIPGSHGCIGMLPADAAWFWDFASHGTPLVIHQ